MPYPKCITAAGLPSSDLALLRLTKIGQSCRIGDLEDFQAGNVTLDQFDGGFWHAELLGEEFDCCLVGSAVDRPFGDSDFQMTTKVGMIFPSSDLVFAGVGDKLDA